MPYYRRRRTVYRRRRPMNGTKRMFNRRRKFYRGSAGTRAKSLLNDGTVYAFKRTIQGGSIVGTAGATSLGAISFNLNALTNPTEFTSLYDSYKISGVKILFMPRITEATGVVGSNGFGTFMYVPDYDDATTPVNQLEILERQSAKLRQAANRPWKIYLKPAAGVNIPTGFAQAPRSLWIDTSSPATPYYGLKYAWNNITTGSTIDVYYTYYLKFKGVK